jgi:L,D-transpeptidase YcbB
VIGAKWWASVAFIPLLMAAGTLRAQTALRCETVEAGGQIREVCAPRHAQDAIRIDLPEPTTTSALSLDLLPPPSLPSLMLPPPELPPAPIVAVLPSPQIKLTPPVEPPALNIPRPSAAVAEIPADAVKTAIERLKSGNRITSSEAAAVLAFYQARSFAPLWITDGRWNPRAVALRTTLNNADDQGMDAKRYRTVSAFIPTAEPSWPALAAAEAGLTEALVLYAREAATGRIAPGRVHPLITPDLKHAAADTVLKTLSEAPLPGEALLAFNPSHQQFVLLGQKLIALRANRAPVADVIPEGPLLRVGMRDARVPLIRARLGMGYTDERVYDRTLAIRVAGLQRTAGLLVNGTFNDATRRALSGESPSLEEAEIIANMERWRWMPRDLGTNHIFVNVPELTMRLKRGQETVLQSRVIVGKFDTQTPFFSDEMDHIVLNPSWYVPPGILKREPKYLDPAWATARGYEIRRSGNNVSVRVPPSASNALGNVKFMFPNSHAVYLHDTPGRHLFNAQNRTLSNGCVRVENPFRLAAQLFAEQGWTEERFRSAVGRGERHMRLPRKLPIHIGHFTMTISPEGEIIRHYDVYGHSARLRQLLDLS